MHCLIMMSNHDYLRRADTLPQKSNEPGAMEKLSRSYSMNILTSSFVLLDQRLLIYVLRKKRISVPKYIYTKRPTYNRSLIEAQKQPQSKNRATEQNSING